MSPPPPLASQSTTSSAEHGSFEANEPPPAAASEANVCAALGVGISRGAKNEELHAIIGRELRREMTWEDEWTYLRTPAHALYANLKSELGREPTWEEWCRRAPLSREISSKKQREVWLNAHLKIELGREPEWDEWCREWDKFSEGRRKKEEAEEPRRYEEFFLESWASAAKLFEELLKLEKAAIRGDTSPNLAAYLANKRMAVDRGEKVLETLAYEFGMRRAEEGFETMSGARCLFLASRDGGGIPA